MATPLRGSANFQPEHSHKADRILLGEKDSGTIFLTGENSALVFIINSFYLAYAEIFD